MRTENTCFTPAAFALLLVVLIPQASAGNRLVEDMAQFDKVYIPALAYTSEEKLKPSRMAMKSLDSFWNFFSAKHRTNTHGDKRWSSDFDKAGKFIKAADRIVASGKNLKQAHEELEHVRIVFMHLRERNNIEYFIDHLTRFHESMEKIVLAAKGRTDKTISDKELNLIRQTLPTAKTMWQAVIKANFGPELYGFDKNKEARLHLLVEKERLALRRLEMALGQENKSEIISAAVAIKPEFAKIFKSFGNFTEKQPAL